MDKVFSPNSTHSTDRALRLISEREGVAPATTFRKAAARGDLKTLKTLIAQVDVNGRSTNGNTALHWAAQWGRVDVVEFLCEQNANSFLCNKEGKTPLLLAKTEDIAYLLIRKTTPAATRLLSVEANKIGKVYRQSFQRNRDAYVHHIQKNSETFQQGLNIAADLHSAPSVLIMGPSDLKDIDEIGEKLIRAKASNIVMMDLETESLALARAKLPNQLKLSTDMSDLTGGIASQFFAQCEAIMKAIGDASTARSLMENVLDRLAGYEPALRSRQYDYVVSPEVISQLSGAHLVQTRFASMYNEPFMSAKASSRFLEKISHYAFGIQKSHLQTIAANLKPHGIAMIAFTKSEGPFVRDEFRLMVDGLMETRISDRFKLIEGKQEWVWVQHPHRVKQKQGGSFKVEAYLVQK